MEDAITLISLQDFNSVAAPTHISVRTTKLINYSGLQVKARWPQFIPRRGQYGMLTHPGSGWRLSSEADAVFPPVCADIYAAVKRAISRARIDILGHSIEQRA